MVGDDLQQRIVAQTVGVVVKWVAINGEKSTQRTIVCLEDFLDLFLPGFLFFEPVHPADVILILDFQFVGDHLKCQFVRRHSESLGI